MDSFFYFSLNDIENVPTSNLPGDPTAKRILMKMFYSERIKLTFCRENYK